MRILLLADRESQSYQGADLLVILTQSAALAGHDVDTVVLSCDELRHCVGCFGCWVKTPGRCVQTADEANGIVARFIKADLVLLLTRITYGGFSADVKALLDRSVPLLCPFFKTIGGEMHHQKRYARYPSLLAFGYGDFTEGEQQTFAELLERNAINFHAPHQLALCGGEFEGFTQALGRVSDFIKAVES